MEQNMKTKIVTKLILFICFNGDKTHKFNMWQNFKGQNATKNKIKNKINVKKIIHNMTKLKTLKIWQDSKAQKVTKLKKSKLWSPFVRKTHIVTKLKNSNCENSTTQTMKKSKNQILTNLKTSNWGKTQKLKWWHN